ncbi:helix-turn-helix domain-containing protein [Dawidia soli]|uniref:AraC family transcriptional regulator n=1 Tax=Dawidia soli TaxID=2782352 RepID=A0AAP2GI39_9BACT|nr:helix-turn-helix transcriptional regulator [Dawidia soli]MBT1687080.1 AraC family transcriptional regulator [Dawidia soli]
MKKRAGIPTFNLRGRGKEMFEIARVVSNELGLQSTSPHRDENYILMFQESGKSRVMIDFHEVEVHGCAALCILPGQVHHGIYTRNAVFWFIAVDSDWIHPSFRSVLMESAVRNRSIAVDPAQVSFFKDSFRLLLQLDGRWQQDPPVELTLRSMLDVCLNLFSLAIQRDLDVQARHQTRPALITEQFRKLVLANFRVMKSPAQYAAALHISPAYLNEVVKATTGNPVSYWIHHEVILEAKRTLFYTSQSVKEIAFRLGYDDPGYFNRLFRKTTGQTPLQFREKIAIP